MNRSNVVNLDDFRPQITESMHCLFCGMTHVLRHIVHNSRRYFSCPGCDEIASVPERMLTRR